MDQYLKKQVVERAKAIIETPEKRKQMVEKNFQVALRHFSYRVLLKHLNYLITKIFGIRV